MVILSASLEFLCHIALGIIYVKFKFFLRMEYWKSYCPIVARADKERFGGLRCCWSTQLLSQILHVTLSSIIGNCVLAPLIPCNSTRLMRAYPWIYIRFRLASFVAKRNQRCPWNQLLIIKQLSGCRKYLFHSSDHSFYYFSIERIPGVVGCIFIHLFAYLLQQ